ncbi:MAG TPA: bifunctional phosphopantothenoylcysteine decarboxylase/phosphopantothenate--cysteine ligase CoaBC [Thermoanaerobaculia bacterium]|jgi:phosphopantothenoylcysteine decarboxylase/phosphopantothenate--cysteine ligase|nr:bifunctional phosphopantothenoylcysteine decarboxylase/phosphopantothenate--cysteine ligase CoaBC [Thermoanaerobaculia bacterium]
MSAPRVLLGVGGGIAAVKAPDLVRRLREAGCEVRCALTRAAASFVTPLALEVLSGHRVYDESYLSPGFGPGPPEEAHLAAGDWAEVFVVAPATAHVVARLALGLADDFITTAALASPRPLLLAPAMHARMWEHPATRAHAATLHERGVRFIGPVVGALASGEVALGRMAEPAEIVAAVLDAGDRAIAASAAAPRWRGVQVLVSAGPTWEALDPVRFLANRSSGKMGFALAAEAARRGAAVELVAGPVSLPTPPGVRRTDVESARDMREAMLRRVADADLVVMAAAVADYRPRDAAQRKLKKEEGTPRVELVENPDILAELAAQPGDRLVVGFAAETDDLARHAAEKLRRKGAAFLVANDVSRGDIGFGSGWNEVTVFRRDAEPVRLPRQSKETLAAALLDLFADSLPARRVPAAAATERA